MLHPLFCGFEDFLWVKAKDGCLEEGFEINRRRRFSSLNWPFEIYFHSEDISEQCPKVADVIR